MIGQVGQMIQAGQACVSSPCGGEADLGGHDVGDLLQGAAVLLRLLLEVVLGGDALVQLFTQRLVFLCEPDQLLVQPTGDKGWQREPERVAASVIKMVIMNE